MKPDTTERTAKKLELQCEQERLTSEANALRGKLDELAAKVADGLARRDEAAKRSALGEVSDSDFRKAHVTFAEIEARHAGTVAALAEIEAMLDRTNADLHQVLAAEAEEVRARAVVASTLVAEASAASVHEAFKALALALGDVTLKLHDLAALDAPRATRIAASLRNEAMVARLRDEGFVPLGITAAGGANVASAPAMVQTPAGDWPGSVPLAAFLRFRAAAARQPAETAEVA